MLEPSPREPTTLAVDPVIGEKPERWAPTAALTGRHGVDPVMARLPELGRKHLDRCLTSRLKSTRSWYSKPKHPDT